MHWLLRLAADLELHIDVQAKQRGLSIEHLVGLASLTGHILNTALANKMPERYAYRMFPAATVLAANASAIVIDGIVFLEQAIEVSLDGQVPVIEVKPA